MSPYRCQETRPLAARPTQAQVASGEDLKADHNPRAQVILDGQHLLVNALLDRHSTGIHTDPGMEFQTSRCNHALTPARVNRKIALLKRCGLFAEKTPGVEILRACSAEDLRAAYTLVHEVFVKRGYCKAEEYGMRLRVFEATPEMATFIAKANGRIVGVLSVVGHTPDCGLPSDRAFKPELDTLRAKHPEGRYCEWSNQVVAGDFRKTNIPTELMRCAAAHVIHAGYSHSIISVSSIHAGFYELLGFKQISHERSHSKEIDDPVVAFCLSSSLYLAPVGQEDEVSTFVRRFMTNENPYLPEVAKWNSKAKQLFANHTSLQQLFGARTKFLRRCDLRDQAVIIREWGPDAFRKVLGHTIPRCAVAWFGTLCFLIASLLRTWAHVFVRLW